MSKETYQCEVLGDVVVQSLRWSHKLKLQKDDVDEDLRIPMTLNMVVVDSKGDQLKTVDEWDDFVGTHQDAGIALFNKCWSLNDFDGSIAAKK